jgi:hypothetical protein
VRIACWSSALQVQSSHNASRLLRVALDSGLGIELTGAYILLFPFPTYRPDTGTGSGY